MPVFAQETMNWKLKANALAVLSRVPCGRKFYQGLQRGLGTNRLQLDEYLGRAIEIIELAREGGKESASGTWFEIGTGWWPVLPFVLYLSGADRIVTVDVNPWLSVARARECYQALGTKIDELSRRLNLDPGEVSRRHAVGLKHQQSHLNEFLSACSIEYCCPSDAGNTKFEDGTLDVVCSSNVLEHIPIDVLKRIHAESRRTLRPGGLAVHRFDPADHFSFADESITTVNFLRFNPRQWHWYGGSGLAFHNRLRGVEHQQIFEKAGFSIRVKRIRTNTRSLEALQNGEIPLQPEFRAFSNEDLAVEYMWLVGKPE